MAHFTGNLELDSPNCLKLIKDLFGAASANQIYQHYLELFSTKQIVEPITNRTPGARYNPRPARLVHILIKEAGCTDFEIIKTAFDLSFKADSLILADLKVPIDFNLLTMANLLDELRHLHMQPDLSNQTIKDVVAFVQNFGQSKMLNQRLHNLILASVDRLLRIKIRVS